MRLKYSLENNVGNLTMGGNAVRRHKSCSTYFRFLLILLFSFH